MEGAMTDSLGADAARRFVDALAASAQLWCAKSVRATLHAGTPVAEALALDSTLRTLSAGHSREPLAPQLVWATAGRGVAPGACQLVALDGAGRELLRETYAA
jgi:hypothetical protein